MSKQINVRLPVDTDLVDLKKKLKDVKHRTGKSANKKIVEYIFKLI